MHNEENFRQFCQRLVAMCSYAPSQWNGSSPQRKRTDGGWRGAFCLMYEKYMALNICKEGLMVDRRALLVYYAHLNIFFLSIRTKEVQS